MSFSSSSSSSSSFFPIPRLSSTFSSSSSPSCASSSSSSSSYLLTATSLSWSSCSSSVKAPFPPRRQRRRRLYSTTSRVTAAFASVLLACFGPAVVTAGDSKLRGSATPANSPIHQVLVLDAGSSGTRIHIFDLLPSAGIVSEHVPKVDLEAHRNQKMKVTPGLSSFAVKGDCSGAASSIKELLNFADKFVHEARRSTTPVLLKATAGLRSISDNEADEILDCVRGELSSSGYRFQPEWASVIQGKEEGGLAWVAVNYLKGTFNTGSGSSTGILEMGGASAQVTFEVQPEVLVAADDLFVFETARGRRYPLYAHSYLGYGSDRARRAFREKAPEGTSLDPCFGSGYSRVALLQLDGVEAAANAGTQSGSNHSISSGSAAFPPEASSAAVVVPEVATALPPPSAVAAPAPELETLVWGSGDATACHLQIQERLFQESAVGPGSYRAELPILGGDFVATGVFSYTQEDLHLHLDDKPLEPTTLQSAADNACRTPFDPSAGPKGWLNVACFGLVYESSFLEALRLWQHHASVRIVDEIQGQEVEWALGAALVHFLEGHSSRDPSWQLDSIPLSFAAVSLCLTFVFLPSLRRQLSQQKGVAASVLPRAFGLPRAKVESSSDFPLE